jgi:hypothetical protein
MPIDYLNKLQGAKPTVLERHVIPPPPGSMSAPTVVPELVIPPLNTDIRFSGLQSFDLRSNPKIAQMAASSLPDNFNWARPTVSLENAKEILKESPEITRKKMYIQKVGNQRLCGSCWAISSAQIISDNFVVSGVAGYDPKLSTTWILSNYPQGQCKGGNPTELFKDVAKNGITSDYCIDYSWCSKNEKCNGNATKHFEANEDELNAMIPPPGCYNDNSDHFVYKIKPSLQTIEIGKGGMTEDNAAITVKKHIFNNGPVCGAFFVYKNFMSGDFSKTESEIYFDRGVYAKPVNILKKVTVTFSNSALAESEYAGAHAVAIIGWGVAKNTVWNEKGDRADVPYWYCRNSWTSKWADDGYFKMAMYPYNKVSQFDKLSIIKINGMNVSCGGIVMLNVAGPPEIKKLKGIPAQKSKMPKENDDKYYKTDPNIKNKLKNLFNSDVEEGYSSSVNINNHLLKVVLISIAILILILFLAKRKK